MFWETREMNTIIICLLIVTLGIGVLVGFNLDNNKVMIDIQNVLTEISNLLKENNKLILELREISGKRSIL
jgi:hypothetical protein